jgi:hypothetical protein
MKTGILFCTPAYGGMMLAPHVRSIMNLKETLQSVGLQHDWLIGWNESLVHRARMEMVATFLRTDWSHLMFLDADIEFEPDDVAKLWNLNADVAVGVYPMKKREQCLYAAWKDGALIKNLDQFNGPIEVDYAGTGFMLIRRDVITTLAESAPSYEGPNGRVPGIFMTPIHNDVLESEDYHFCRIAREAGFPIIMDPSVRLLHWGQHAYGQHVKQPTVSVHGGERVRH